MRAKKCQKNSVRDSEPEVAEGAVLEECKGQTVLNTQRVRPRVLTPTGRTNYTKPPPATRQSVSVGQQCRRTTAQIQSQYASGDHGEKLSEEDGI
jgi:hypothetical protein